VFEFMLKLWKFIPINEFITFLVILWIFSLLEKVIVIFAR